MLATMKRATTFMVEKVEHQRRLRLGYLPDLSRRWGEMEARASMIWIQPPGTPTMGHLFLDAYHATGDDYYYQAAEKVAGALIWGQHPSGGWNYMVDFAGERRCASWYDTVGKNGWRLEEFQHYWGNATFDDAGTAEASKFLLRLYVEKRDPKYKPALDKAIASSSTASIRIGALAAAVPAAAGVQRTHGKPDYTSFPTFNDDVAAENIDFLLMCYQALGDDAAARSDPRGMNAFLVTQQPAPQAGWALQYTPDLKPVGARTYEPDALVTHTTASNVELLMRVLPAHRRHEVPGPDPRGARLARIRDARRAGVAPAGRTHPTFIEIGTNKPLYVHRRVRTS